MRATPIVALALALAACRAEPTHAPAERSIAIYGGKPSAPCAWPTTVFVEGCTGTLVHPELVLLAAHCVPLGPTRAVFGDDYTEPAFEAEIATCAAHPESSTLGNDIGFCRLLEPVTGIPIVPIIAGCETAAIAPGVDVVAVGFGEADDTLGPGPKRDVTMPIVAVSERDAEIGGGGKDTCTGDSGGPVFVRLGDGTWRLFGVTSYGNTCGEGGHYSLIAPALGWLESASDLDLTPCHDGATWSPTASCTELPTAPDTGGGSWTNRCATTDVSGFGASCGEPFDPNAPPPSETPSARGGCAHAPPAPRDAPRLVFFALALAAVAARRTRTPRD